MIISKVIVFAVILDLILGDPYWLPHPVVIIGKLIDKLESCLRNRIAKKSLHGVALSKALRRSGALLTVMVCVLTLGVSGSVCFAAWKISPWLFFALQIFWGFQTLAIKGLVTESKNVYSYLAPRSRKRRGNGGSCAGEASSASCGVSESDGDGCDKETLEERSRVESGTSEKFNRKYEEEMDLLGARKAVARIVGRDTSELTAEGIIKATVETVAENFADGVLAPLFYLAIGGAPLALTYKAVNTMDSMLGYKNDKYIDFGRIPARLDDVCGYVPARLAALFFVASAAVSGLDWKSAFRIWRRDRYNHASPNSAHTEAACAGALGVQLAGPACYFGKYYDKPTIGDAKRKIEANDILRANRLMVNASLIVTIVFVALRYLIFALVM